MDKYKIARNIDKIFAAKLNTLSPNGDFFSFASLIRLKRYSAARKLIRDNNNNNNNNNNDNNNNIQDSSTSESVETLAPPTLDFQFLNNSNSPKKSQIINDVNNHGNKKKEFNTNQTIETMH